MAKKSFLSSKDNPTLSYISKDTIAAAEESGEEQLYFEGTQPPAGYKIDPKFIEKRTKRVQLVLQPSLYNRVKDASRAAGMSLNDYVHKLLEEATR